MSDAHTQKRRRNRGVLAIALVLSATVVWHASFSAFVATTSNPANSWQAGSLSLAATDGSGGSLTGAAVFGATGWRPGDSLVKCITVTYGGNITAGAPVRLYATGPTTSAAVNGHTLSSYLQVTVEEGTGALNTSCGGFVSGGTIFDSATNIGTVSATAIAGSLNDFVTNRTNYATGIATSWTPSTGSTSQSYRFTVSFPSSGSNSTDTDLMGMTATTAFTWEVQS
jgi:hypothetical protein